MTATTRPGTVRPRRLDQGRTDAGDAAGPSAPRRPPLRISSTMPHSPRRRPSLETLADRRPPAGLGMTWPDPQHLTLSLIPDGPPVSGVPSTLDRTLSPQLGTTAWELAALRAF